ncbi:MAG: T9SS type A sorting domain-containing protein [Bacteroidota bacterium]|nr:T9SS type A sorting domain-containing protein [Bacteroidota bacterium]
MKKQILLLLLLLLHVQAISQISPCTLTGGNVYIDHNSPPWMMNATVNGMSTYSYAWIDTNGVVVSTGNQTPFYTRWCVTITDNITACDTTICQDCIADSNSLCACPMIYMPVCGCDGLMYSNYCIADCADVPWVPATSNGMPGGFLACSTWTPTFGQNSCGVEISGDSILCNWLNPQVLTASPNAVTTLPVTYQWYGNGMSSNSNVLTINSPGTYCVTQIDANGCIDSTCINVMVQDIPIYTVPSPPIICLGDSIVLEIDTFGLSNIGWVPNSLPTPPVHRIVDVPIFSHAYIVEAIDTVGCERRGEIFVIVDSCSTSMNELFNKQLKIYPNPTSGKVNVELPKGVVVDISLTDLQGRVIHQKEDVFEKYIFNTKEVAKGMYLIKVDSQKGKYSRKLLVE